MGSVAVAPLTIEDYRLLPEAGPRYQLVEGDLFMSPAPNRYHQDVLRNLFFIICSYLERHRLGIVYCAPFDVFLDEINAHQPDLVFVSKKNDILTAAGAEGAPDFLVEILSPKTAFLDKGGKRKVNARSGVKEYWIILGLQRQVEVHRQPENGRYQQQFVLGQDDTLECASLPTVRIRVSDLFV